MEEIIKEYNSYLDSVIAELSPTFTGTALSNPNGLAALSKAYHSRATDKANEILNKELSNDRNTLMLKLKEAQSLKHGDLVTQFL